MPDEVIASYRHTLERQPNGYCWYRTFAQMAMRSDRFWLWVLACCRQASRSRWSWRTAFLQPTATLKGMTRSKHRAEGDFDLTVVVDCSDLLRTGKALQKYGTPDINIDHHKTNLRFARLNLVEPEAVATSSVLLTISG